MSLSQALNQFAQNLGRYLRVFKHCHACYEHQHSRSTHLVSKHSDFDTLTVFVVLMMQREMI